MAHDRKPLGFVLKHRDVRHGTVTVPLKFWPYPKQSLKTCPVCRVVHHWKTYHLTLVDGSVNVSGVIFNNLVKAGAVDGEQPQADVPAPLRPFEYDGRIEAAPLVVGMARGRIVDRDGRDRTPRNRGQLVRIYEDFESKGLRHG